MKKIPPLYQTLCLKFCAYYKPGKKEDLACRGYEVVERLQQAGITMEVSPSEQKPDRATAEMLVQKMCITCDFHEKDCDFMMDRTAPPCGGFALLAQLLGSGALVIEDIG
jgi:hypothetical protein